MKKPAMVGIASFFAFLRADFIRAYYLTNKTFSSYAKKATCL
jgi:hypothetical protein